MDGVDRLVLRHAPRRDLLDQSRDRRVFVPVCGGALRIRPMPDRTDRNLRALDLRQSVIGWTIGLIVGTIVAAAVIAAIAGLL